MKNPELPQLRVEQAYIDRLEASCDHYNEQLDPLRSFVLPGGTAVAAHLHVARTIVRRAERSTWAALAEHGRTDESADCDLPQPTQRPALHPQSSGERGRDRGRR